MKGIRKTIMSLAWSFAFVVGIMASNKLTVDAASQMDSFEVYMEQAIPSEAKRVAENSYKDMVNVVLHKQDYFDVKRSDLMDVKLGKPFVIFEEELGQDEIYYFPLVKNNKVIMVLGVSGANNGWGVSLGTEYVAILNDIGYSKNSYYFIKRGETLIAENPLKSYGMRSVNNNMQITIKPSSFVLQEKRVDLAERITSFNKVNVEKALKNYRMGNKLEGYAPSFGTSTSTAKVMALHNPQGQGQLELCWAASVSTIVNYVYGTNYSATDVADDQEVAYKGQDIYTKQKALDYYGVNYDYITNSQLSYNIIKKNVNNQRPVAVTAKSGKWMHAVTLYGYGSNYIYLWNSGLDGGNGSSQLIKYNSTGTTFPYNNMTYAWTASLHAAK